MRRTLIITAIFTAIALIPASATIIDVPSVDYPTIQAGIDSSSDGDTVLVQPGMYIENIDFNGHNIVLGSLFLTTSDTSYISSTIIDGDSTDRVVTFNNSAESNAVLTGFTIQNGFASQGGGISIHNSKPHITNNIIRDNTASSDGGGVYVSSSHLLIENNIITGNTAGSNGGGIYSGGWRSEYHNNVISNNIADNGGGVCNNTETIWTYNVISENSASGNGGGGCYSDYVQFFHNIVWGNTADLGGGIYSARDDSYWANLVMWRCTFYGNRAETSGGGLWALIDYVSCSEVWGDNSIFWSNTAPEDAQIHITGSVRCGFYHCDIQNGCPPICGSDDNIDCNPMFCNPNEGNFYITDNSCCRYAGWDSTYIGALDVGCTAYPYLLGDANMYLGMWPPSVIGGDKTYLSNYLTGIPVCLPCLIDGFWASADVNGDCQIIGSDATKLVNYLRGLCDLEWCPDYPPMWLVPADLPEEAPEGWPNCE